MEQSFSDTDATGPTNIVVTRKERQLRPRHLEQIDGEGAPQTFKLAQDELIIGRAEDAGIRLPSQRLSRHHARLKRRGEECEAIQIKLDRRVAV